MAKLKKIYKCEICGNIVEVLNEGPGSLVCCGEQMVLLEEKNADSTVEKHVPIVEITNDKIKVTVGSTLHPMTEEHYIQFIELMAEDKIYTKFLKPGDEPKAEFEKVEGNFTVREYCNVHGLWSNK